MIATMTLLVTALWMPAQDPAPTETPAEAPATSASAMSAEDHIEAGKALFRKKRFAAAREHFQQAVAANPDSAAAHFYLGYTIYKIAEPKRPNSPGKQEAAAHFAKAYELDPGYKPVWKSRG
jgi:tetratricopeptide (TPR) repeat protein